MTDIGHGKLKTYELVAPLHTCRRGRKTGEDRNDHKQKNSPSSAVHTAKTDPMKSQESRICRHIALNFMSLSSYLMETAGGEHKAEPSCTVSVHQLLRLSGPIDRKSSD